MQNRQAQQAESLSTARLVPGGGHLVFGTIEHQLSVSDAILFMSGLFYTAHCFVHVRNVTFDSSGFDLMHNSVWR